MRHMTFTFLIRVATHLVDSFWGGLYPSAEKLGPISIPRGSLGGMFFKFIYTVVRMQISAIKTPLLLDTPLRIKFVRLGAGRWFSRYTPPIKQDSHGIKHHNSPQFDPPFFK